MRKAGGAVGNKKRIMLIDNEEGLCRMMEAVLTDSGYEVKAYTRSFEAVEEFRPGEWDLVVSDIKMPGMDGIELLQRIKEKEPGVPVVMITAFATVETSIQALRRGAYDMLTKPFEPEELLYRVKNALSQRQLQTENRELKAELAGKFRFDAIIGASQGLKSVLERAEKIAGRDISILITGESGTGKELIAQAIHYNSPRKDKKFVAINCGALPESILESELFGCKKGAFTGATENRQGLLETANGGTLFLDEMGEMSFPLQVKLLRVLQEGEIRRVGASTSRKIDVRVISATSKILSKEVADGRFRGDLFYRLNVFSIDLPPLRERMEDISLLVEHFLAKHAAKLGIRIPHLTPDAMKCLMAYSWPGNVRELENCIERGLVLAEGAIDVDSLPDIIRGRGSDGYSDEIPADCLSLKVAGERIERRLIRKALEQTRGNRTHAARILEISHRSLLYKIKEYSIN